MRARLFFLECGVIRRLFFGVRRDPPLFFGVRRDPPLSQPEPERKRL